MTSDYYPFGMLMEDTTNWRQDTSYLYGFQGQELDNESSGRGNLVIFQYRIHDSRLGRFLSVDRWS
jgi:RHS repeat-associated protein